MIKGVQRMFSFLSRQKPGSATINGQTVEVAPKETILHAALRHGIDFPHSCRVGGCAACKCRLIDGQVKQLTDATYILSDEDLERNCILACQSIPKGHVQVEFDNTPGSRSQRVAAKVVSTERLTHDIVRLTVQLEQSLPYRAGQFATLSFPDLPYVARSYSFASPPNPEGRTSFYVRKVPGGAFSTFVHEKDLTGSTAWVDGPHGDFWLRPGNAPLLMVAGGSGLAPIVAMIKECANRGEFRPLELLFGARTSQDLYELDEIESLKARWKNSFTCTLVLSEESKSSTWSGPRGLVTDFLGEAAARESDAYLCGPPAMVDAAKHKLLSLGASPVRVRADRFTTQAATPTATIL